MHWVSRVTWSTDASTVRRCPEVVLALLCCAFISSANNNNYNNAQKHIKNFDEPKIYACESFALAPVRSVVRECTVDERDTINTRTHSTQARYATRDFVDKIVIYIVILVCSGHEWRARPLATLRVWARLSELISMLINSCDTYVLDGEKKAGKSRCEQRGIEYGHRSKVCAVRSMNVYENSIRFNWVMQMRR